jgi:hypothetical protein
MQEYKDFSKQDRKIEFLPSPINKPLNFAVSIILTAFHDPKKLSDKSVVRESVIKEGLLVSKLLRKNDILFVQKPIQDEGTLSWWSPGIQEAWKQMPLTNKSPFVWSLMTLQSFLDEIDNDEESLILKPRQFLLDIGLDNQGIENLRYDMGGLFKCFVEKDINYPRENIVLDQETIQILSIVRESTEYLDLPLVD